MTRFKVGYFVGSLATASINRLLAKALVGLAPADLQILGFCNSPQMNAIEAYIQFEKGLITDDGQVTNPSVEEFLRTYMAEFHGFIGRVCAVLPRR